MRVAFRTFCTLRRVLLTLGSAATFCAASGPAHAGEASCKPAFDAMLRSATTPHHAFTTLGAGAKSMVTEEIYDGKKIYTLIGGKWSVSSLAPQNVVDAEKENDQDGKLVCTVLRDESIDGVSATLYSLRAERDGDTTNEQIWISKATGLPVHVKTDAPSDTRYVFSGISAPDVR